MRYEAKKKKCRNIPYKLFSFDNIKVGIFHSPFFAFPTLLLSNFTHLPCRYFCQYFLNGKVEIKIKWIRHLFFFLSFFEKNCLHIFSCLFFLSAVFPYVLFSIVFQFDGNKNFFILLYRKKNCLIL